MLKLHWMFLTCIVGMIMTSTATSWAAEPSKTPAKPEKLWVYIGTYTKTASKGIYLLELDLASGKLQPVGLAAETVNPSFLAIHPSRPLLYAVGEMATFGGKKTGAVSAFSIAPKTGMLTLLNQQSTEGAGPCHVSVDRSGRCVLVANYTGGSVACLPIQDDGRLAEAASFVQHVGSSVNEKRQKGPHAHSINVDPANRFAFAADLGLDKILIYRLDPAKGQLTPNQPAFASVPAGAGPRHFAFHPNGRYAYVINEMGCTVTAFQYDADRGSLEPIETVSTLPEGLAADPSITTAEVQVHPSGKFLYGSNRGHHSIAVFAIDPATGKLRAIDHTPTQGKNPRNFGVDPTGTYLLAAHQDTDNIVVFRIDPATGKLTPTGQSVTVPMSVCVKFLQPF
jgi:6-phosphogluconolactonase